jgi:anti-sigma B factor antagonist
MAARRAPWARDAPRAGVSAAHELRPSSPAFLERLVPHMPLDSYVKDDILTIRVLDERLVEPEQLKRLFDDLYALLGKTDEQQVVLDLAGVKFMASAMLGKLVALQKKCEEYRAKLKLASVDPQIMEVFKITKLHKVFDIQPDEATARKSFSKRGFFG